MSKDIHCPNPGCAHVFPAAAVVGVAALVCPKCGGVFQVKAKKQPSPESASQVPIPKPAGRSAIMGWLVGGLIVFVSLTLMTAVIFRKRDPAPPSGPEPFRSTEHNYSVRLPGAAWQQDNDLAKRLHGVLAFRRNDPDAQVVLVVRDYPKYVPTATELREEAAARLLDFPFENLQREDKSDGAQFAGKPAGRFVFQGTIDGTLVSGDVLYLAHQGAAYWLYRWCPSANVVAAETALGEMADHFALLDLHPDWHPPRRSFAGTKLAYTLTAEGDRWEQAPNPPDNYDPAADLALIGRPQEGSDIPSRQALLLVVLLSPGDGDAAERAKAHLLARQKEIYEESTIADVAAADEKGVTDKVGSVAGKVLTLRATNRKDRERFVILGVVPRMEGPLVIWAECDFARRAVWEADFRRLVASFHQAK